MLNLREADITQTRFYQQVLERGEANMVIRQLNYRYGNLSPIQIEKIKSLSSTQLESLGFALLDFQNLSDLENWFNNNEQ